MNLQAEPDTTPLARGAGLELPIEDHRDPFLRLSELMEVLEALCPQWPSRPQFPDDVDWRL